MKINANEPAKINDFVIRFANVNGTGSASANALFTITVFRMGIPVEVRTGSGSDWVLGRWVETR